MDCGGLTGGEDGESIIAVVDYTKNNRQPSGSAQKVVGKRVGERTDIIIEIHFKGDPTFRLERQRDCFAKQKGEQ